MQHRSRSISAWNGGARGRYNKRVIQQLASPNDTITSLLEFPVNLLVDEAGGADRFECVYVAMGARGTERKGPGDATLGAFVPSHA